MPKYFCTAADTEHFNYLLNLIGSIHKHHFHDTEEIAVFNLGFTKEQIKQLKQIEKVGLYEVERTHPDLLTHFKVRPEGRTARGWYAWKPVVIKQALDMFPYVIYMDSGMSVRQSFDSLFEHIKENGYFFYSCGHNVRWMTTRYVLDYFNLDSPERSFILNNNTYGISAGFQGLSRKVYEDYVLPMYELSKNIQLFEDDCTTPNGFGTGRHDQTLFSIFVKLLGLNVHDRAPGILGLKHSANMDTSHIQYVHYKT